MCSRHPFPAATALQCNKQQVVASSGKAPVAVAGAGAAGAAGALCRGRLADPAHLEARQPGSPLQQPLLRAPRVHHIPNACMVQWQGPVMFDAAVALMAAQDAQLRRGLCEKL